MGIEQPQFNPRNPEYKKVADLPLVEQEKFSDVDGGFVTRGAKELHDKYSEDKFSEDDIEDYDHHTLVTDNISTLAEKLDSSLKSGHGEIGDIDLLDLKTFLKPSTQRRGMWREKSRQEANTTSYTGWLDLFLIEDLNLPEDRKEAIKERLLQTYGEQDFEKALEYFKTRLAGQIVVDLGCGTRSDEMAKFANKCGAKAYIGVTMDRIAAIDSEEDLTGSDHLLKDEATGKFTQKFIVKADMADFAFRLPDDSVCFAINGIDDFIIGGKGDAYMNRLTHEIERSMKKDGIIFGCNNHFVINNLKEEYIQRNLVRGCSWRDSFNPYERKQ